MDVFKDHISESSLQEDFSAEDSCSDGACSISDIITVSQGISIHSILAMTCMIC